MQQLLVLVFVIILILLIGAIIIICRKSDEALVKDLVYRSTEAGNDNGYQAIYAMKCPNYRRIVAYE